MNTMRSKWLTTQPKVGSNHLPWISYETTDTLQARGTVVICCPADLTSFSTMIRYVIRENGHEIVFRQKTAIGTATHLLKTQKAQ